MATVAQIGLDTATLVATVLGGLAALLALGAWVNGRYRRTLGRRRDSYERLARLGTGAHLSFFIAVLGEPPAIRQTVTSRSADVVGPDDPRHGSSTESPSDVDSLVTIWEPRIYTESIFIDRDFYVQAICDHEETVLGFTVTRRRRGFRPTLYIPRRLSLSDRLRIAHRSRHWPRHLGKVTLGRTRFADLDATDPEDWTPPHFRTGIGARWASYSEFHYFGNPGHYQTYVFTAGSNAPGRRELHRIAEVVEQAGFGEWPYPSRWDPERFDQPPPVDEAPPWEAIPSAVELRRETVITSYTVIGRQLWAVNYPTQFGPHGDEVRTLP